MGRGSTPVNERLERRRRAADRSRARHRRQPGDLQRYGHITRCRKCDTPVDFGAACTCGNRAMTDPGAP